jgi:hypothetical protein
VNPYAATCDEFGIFAHVNSKTELPRQSETVLHFFEALQKHFPAMMEFSHREGGEYVLEEDHEDESPRWVAVEAKRLTSACSCPPLLEDADLQHERILELAPYHLDLGALNVESIDVLYSFDFECAGSHDQVIAEALGGNTPFDGLMNLGGSRVIGYEPSVLLALDEACKLQARIGVESRTTPYQVRTGQFGEAPLSVYVLVRQFWGKTAFKSFAESYRNQRRISQELIETFVIPQVLSPLAQRIGAR